jgi:hypothetical protein
MLLLVLTALLVVGAAELDGVADDVGTTEEEEVTTRVVWILDATPPTASVAAPAVTGVAGLAVVAATVYDVSSNSSQVV